MDRKSVTIQKIYKKTLLLTWPNQHLQKTSKQQQNTHLQAYTEKKKQENTAYSTSENKAQ